MIKKCTTDACLAARRIVVLFFVITMLIHCTSTDKQTEQAVEYKKNISKELYKIRNEDSLLNVLLQFTEVNDNIGKMLCYKQLGLLQRENARFSDAISSHQQGYEIALMLNDTFEIVQALNNLGTNFRRIGAHNEASQYHYQALNYAEIWSQLHTPTGTKNRIMALNGIGNISLMLGYYNDAEKNFREALKSEIELESSIGQAINYANLGAVFEQRQQYDSAYSYFNKSLKQNEIAKSDI